MDIGEFVDWHNWLGAVFLFCLALLGIAGVQWLLDRREARALRKRNQAWAREVEEVRRRREMRLGR